jgi:hypothetical protein
MRPGVLWRTLFKLFSLVLKFGYRGVADVVVGLVVIVGSIGRNYYLVMVLI